MWSNGSKVTFYFHPSESHIVTAATATSVHLRATHIYDKQAKNKEAHLRPQAFLLKYHQRRFLISFQLICAVAVAMASVDLRLRRVKGEVR